MNKGIKTLCQVSFCAVIAWLVVACLLVLGLPIEAQAEKADLSSLTTVN